MTRLPIGHPARVIGMDSASAIIGSVWRNGGLVYALRGVAGVWPSWLVVEEGDIERPNWHKTCRKCFAAAMRGPARHGTV